LCGLIWGATETPNIAITLKNGEGNRERPLESMQEKKV
jgi:hypothetical protein